jgi:hypothetical protein
MTYQVFVKQEAITDLEDWLNEIDSEEPGLWLSSRVRLCTQSSPGWIVLNVGHEDWWKIRDFFPMSNLFTTE